MMPVVVIKHLYSSDESQGSLLVGRKMVIFFQNNVVNEEWLRQ